MVLESRARGCHLHLDIHASSVAHAAIAVGIVMLSPAHTAIIVVVKVLIVVFVGVTDVDMLDVSVTAKLERVSVVRVAIFAVAVVSNGSKRTVARTEALALGGDGIVTKHFG
jgi:hypothetical protein